MTEHVLQRRQHKEVNNDPQRRCYNGCHFSTEIVVGPWEDLDYGDKPKLERRLKFWTELNDEAVKDRGPGAKKDFRIIERNQNV